MKDMLGGSYWQAVKSTVLPEWLSMNAVMAGMIPVMIILMTRDMRAMEPTSVRFWGIMSLASLVGASLAYPVNWWLVKNGLKHGMGTERALGKGGTDGEDKKPHPSETKAAKHAMSAHDADAKPQPMPEMKTMPEMKNKSGMGGMKMDGSKVSHSRKVVATLITIAMLVGGSFFAARYGDLSMRAGKMSNMPMENMKR